MDDLLYIRIIQLLGGILIFAFIVLLMVKKKANATYSLVWVVFAVCALVLGVFPEITVELSELLHISYPPILIVLVLVVALIIISLYMSSEISISQDKIRELSIHISLLNDEMRLLKEKDGQIVSRQANCSNDDSVSAEKSIVTQEE